LHPGWSPFRSAETARPHLLCVGGEDHHLRIPFLLALTRQGFRVTAVASGDQEPFRRAGLPYRSFRFDRYIGPLSDQAAVRDLRAILREERADLAQSFDTKPNLLVPFAARDVPGTRVVRTINGLGWVYSARTPLALGLRPVQRMLHRFAARSVAATVFQNRDDMVFFERHGMLGGRPARLIPGSGIDLAGFAAAAAGAPAPGSLRAMLGLGAAPVVLTVTRLTRHKGIPTLLNAAARVHAIRPDVRFVLVGPRETEGALAVSQREIDRRAPYVVALGRREDVPALLGIADVFAFPTEYREGVPRALLEAALAGLPIVATAMPGCNDVIRDGSSGFLVPPRRPGLLAGRILDLLAERHAARAMGRRARARVVQEFGLDLTVARYCRLYADLLGTAMPCSGAVTQAQAEVCAAEHPA
jgi:glycosyltransferase involved in cell wall biosynthesis